MLPEGRDFKVGLLELHFETVGDALLEGVFAILDGGYGFGLIATHSVR